MQNLQSQISSNHRQFTRPGTVVGIDGEHIRIAFGLGKTPRTTVAVCALGTLPQLGDRVLVIGDEDGEDYIIALLERRSPTRVVRVDDAERLRVEDSRGRLLFEHDGERTTVAVPEGDLELRTDEGAIRLSAGPTDLRLSPHGMSLHAAAATVDVESTTFRGRTMQGFLRRARWVYEKLETVADRLFERSKNTYRSAEELHQTRAGRMRTLVDGAYRLRSRETDLRSDADVRIDGKHIHLG